MMLKRLMQQRPNETTKIMMTASFGWASPSSNDGTPSERGVSSDLKARPSYGRLQGVGVQRYIL